ncbi:MAG: NifU family protein [Chitinophagales bacterium]
MNQVPEYIEIYTESTPNPKTLKFVFTFMLLEKALLECTSIEDTEYSPLAKELLELEDIASVFISNNFITLTKSDTTDKEWFELGIEMKAFFKNYFKSGKIAVTEDFQEKSAKKQEISSEKTAAIIEKIELLLEKYVKPAVESDGGNIAFSSFEQGVVKVELQGACSGCPSSTATLKDGIEALLQKMIPEVEEVVAING